MTTVSSKRAAPARVNGDAGTEAAGLLGGKLSAPQPVFRALRRTRLTNLLDVTTQQRVTLVSAPAGSGKTTACSSWARGRLDRTRIAWLSLDHADNDPARFRAYLVAALGRAGPSPDLPRAAHHAPAAEFPLPLVKVAEQFTEPVALILDDVHALTDDTVLGWLDQLIRYAPPMLRLVLSGRRAPPLQLARLRVSGDLADIGAADLACTPEEAEAYFTLLGLHVDRAERDELLRHTEGWMAGLRLAALRVRARSAGVSITDIAGDDPIVTDYLRDEVLTGEDPQVRAFLLRTSIVANLTGELADALTGAADGAWCLDKLSRENGFVEAFDSERAGYRYHPLLRELLLAELRREMPHEIPVLLGRAARWYAHNGQPAEALRCCAEAPDWDFAAEVLAGNDIGILLARGPAEIERMLTRIPPDSATRDTAVGAALAAARLWQDDPDGARAHLAAVAAMLEKAPQPARRTMAPKLDALRLMLASFPGCAEPGLLASASARAEQAGHAVTRDEHRAAGMLRLVCGMAYLRRSQLVDARRALRTADRELGAGDAAELQIRARTWLALTEAWHGNLRAAGNMAVQVLNADRPAALATRHIARLALALVSLMRDELTVVNRMLDQIDYGEHRPIPGEPSLVYSAGLIQAHALIARGDMTRARAALTQLGEQFGRTDPAVAEAITSLEGEVALRTGDQDLTRQLIARLRAARTGDAGSGRPTDRLTLAWLLIAAADPEAALPVIAPLLADPAEDLKLHERVGALLVAAVAHRRLKSPERAAELLEKALLLAEPEGAYRVFIDGGPAVRSVLTVLVPPTSRSAGFASKILQRLDAQLPVGSGAGNGDTLPLSDSELAVLRFLPSHLTNTEIGEALFLSVNTVKTHLRSAYRKLGVRSRREAIALARQHGLVA